eukprot:1160954-Pelagomonas_calceolata.AAC.1
MAGVMVGVLISCRSWCSWQESDGGSLGLMEVVVLMAGVMVGVLIWWKSWCSWQESWWESWSGGSR